jgi:hypothetical protein
MHRPSFRAALALIAIALAGCGREASVPTAGNAPPSVIIGVRSAAPDVSVTGTYDGSVTEVEGSHSRSGGVVIAIKQKGTKISGTFDITFSSGHDYDLTLSGSVTSKTKKGAKLAITLTYSNGETAKGAAALAGKKLSGKATAQAKSGTATITFDARKKKRK